MLANLVAATAPSFAVLLGARMIAAVFAAGFTPTASVTASALAKPEQRGRALALVYFRMSVAMIAGVPIGTVLSNLGSWRTTFVFVALLGIVASIGIHVFVPHTSVPSAERQKRRIAILRNPAV